MKKINKKGKQKAEAFLTFPDRKGVTQMWWIIAAAIIALLAVIFILLWFRGAGEKAFDSVGGQIDNLGDCDGDQVANLFDKCPCLAGEGNPELDGCPSNINEAQECTTTQADNCKKCGKLTCPNE